MNYIVGKKVIFVFEDGTLMNGEIIENFKLPGDICIRWESGQTISYDQDWLDENVEINSK